jgi:hypothetical protein
VCAAARCAAPLADSFPLPPRAHSTLANNLVTGVSTGFEKKLTLIGVGYRAAVEGTKKLTLALGYSHPVEMPIPAGLTVKARARAARDAARRRSARAAAVDKCARARARARFLGLAAGGVLCMECHR